MKMVLITYLTVAILLYNLQMVVSERKTPTCTIGHLDEKSFMECGNRGYAMRCNDTSLVQIPNFYPKPQNLTKFPPPLCLLDLSYNKFYRVENKSFVDVKNLNSTDVLWLYLDHSNISFIASDAFLNLTNLLYLNLSANNLIQPGSFGDGVFKPLVSLRDINVKQNKLKNFTDIGRQMQYLKTIKGIYIDLCQKCVFGEEFSKLTNLKTISLSGRSEKDCYSPDIDNITFQYVPTVENLYIAWCHIRSIDKNAFTYLKNISLLDISYNEDLKFTGMNEALYGLKNSTTLKELSVNRIHKLYESGIQLKLSDIENLKTLRALETLHMDLNKIEVFDENILKDYQLPATLRNLTLSGNRLTYGKYVKYLHHAVGITFLDLSRQHLNYDPFFHEHYKTRQLFSNSSIVKEFSKSADEKCSGFCAVCLPSSLRKVKWRKSFIYLKIVTPFAICGATGLNHLDLSFNLISKWNATIFGVENVTHLDLSQNDCDEVDPKFFLMFTSLKHLNISGNSLWKFFDPHYNPNASKMFEFQRYLTKLDLSFNKISRLPWDIFKNSPNLKYLNLSQNDIGEWNTTFNSSCCLRHLDLSGNKLYELPETLTRYLDTVAEGRCTLNAVVNVTLSSNPIECSCKTLPFLKWLRYSKVNVFFKPEDICRLNGESYQYLSNEHMEEIINILENDICLDRSWVTWTISVACSGFVCLLTVFVSCIIYRNRWKLRYLYYSRNRRYMHEGFEHLFENDAFVSYVKNSASFIKNEMVPSLETQHGLHLWVADRNSVPGTSVAENISHGIYNSRKSVLLINKEYLDDSWCDYEMNMAQMESIETKRKLIIIVLMESIPMESLPVCLMRFLHNERSLEYPEHQQDISTFWMNLAEEIRC